MAVLRLHEAEQLIVDALMRARTSLENAQSVARALVGAEADGLKGHGLSRVPTYAAQAKAGKVDGFARPSLQTSRPGVLMIDARNGFAYPALEAATTALPDTAQTNGIAAAAIHRSHHCGSAGQVVERLANSGLVALIFANTPAAIAPWGGAKPVFGTNPTAFACPLPDRLPLVIDLSLSVVARGNILAAKQKGERIPQGWALDAEGKPTTDPDAALQGTMLPFGDAKGTALALMVELLAAGLTGANYAAEASSFLDAQGGPPGTGQLILTLDPAAFSANAPARFAALSVQIETQAGARLPSARRYAARAKAVEQGIAVADTLLTEIARI